MGAAAVRPGDLLSAGLSTGAREGHRGSVETGWVPPMASRFLHWFLMVSEKNI